MVTHPSILLIKDSPGKYELFRLALTQTGLDMALYTEHAVETALHFLNDRYHQSSLQARLFSPQGWGLIDLLLRASNEGSPRPRVARAQKIISLHPLLCSESTGDRSGYPHSSSVTRDRSLYNPAPASRWTDCTTQPCEHTHDSPLTDPLVHPRPAVSHQRRDLYQPRRYLRDRAADDAGLWDDQSRDGTGKGGRMS
jgi:hypothetical protein